MLLFVLCGVFFVVLGNAKAENMEGMRAMSNECRKETGYEGTHRDIFKNPTPEGKCFEKCIMMKRKDMMSDGTIDVKQMKNNVQKMAKSEEMKNKSLEAIEACTEEVKPEKDLCEAAFKFRVCIHKKVFSEKKP